MCIKVSLYIVLKDIRDLVCSILTIADTTDPTDLQTAFTSSPLQTVVSSLSQRENRKISEKYQTEKKNK